MKSLSLSSPLRVPGSGLQRSLTTQVLPRTRLRLSLSLVQSDGKNRRDTRAASHLSPSPFLMPLHRDGPHALLVMPPHRPWTFTPNQALPILSSIIPIPRIYPAIVYLNLQVPLIVHAMQAFPPAPAHADHWIMLPRLSINMIMLR